jgi:hypothetical protein
VNVLEGGMVCVDVGVLVGRMVGVDVGVGTGEVVQAVRSRVMRRVIFGFIVIIILEMLC